jgi:diaminopimelate epimerase
MQGKGKLARNFVMHTINFPIPFWKMNGAGNDFIIIDHRSPLVPDAQMAEFARLVCRRKFSVGADGLFLIESSECADFKWRFFNSDGSEAEMCGNGARCVARVASLHGIAGEQMRFETLAGIIEAHVSGSEATIRMTTAHSMILDQQLVVDGQELVAHSINTGVPHCVIFVNDLGQVDVVGLGRSLRFHPHFAPAGTNVNFACQVEENIAVRTYERGVEGETLACGTGVVATALIARAKGLAESPVQITTVGGSVLRVDCVTAKNVTLSGPAFLVYRAELTKESLL